MHKIELMQGSLNSHTNSIERIQQLHDQYSPMDRKGPGRSNTYNKRDIGQQYGSEDKHIGEVGLSNLISNSAHLTK